jgi:LPXTG-motif cell wall-anchored protein
MLEPMLIGTVDGPAPKSSGPGAAATTGGEQNGGLIVAILVVVLAIAGYLFFQN